MRTVIDTENFKVSIIENESSHVTLCFTGIGHAIGGIDIQSEEFIKSSMMSTSLFIVDKHRSWGNNIDFSELKKILDPYIKDKIVNSIGNSMGGFLAILASKFFDIKCTVAIVPQFSVSKKIIPSESRWDNYVDKIKEWKYESLVDSFNDDTQYYILAGTGGRDDNHLKLIPNKKNIHKIYFKNVRFIHDVANILKHDGLLYPVIQDCFKGVNSSEIIRSHFTNDEYEISELIELDLSSPLKCNLKNT